MTRAGTYRTVDAMLTFADVIALWASLSALAADLGVPYGVVKQWRRRNSIPADRWAGVVAAAQKRGFETVTADRLMAIAEARTDQDAA